MSEENTVPEQDPPQAEPVAGNAASLDLVMDVAVRVTVEVGSARLRVRDVLQFGKGSVIELDRGAGEPADLLVNGRLLARGEVTVVDDRLAVRVIELVQTVPGSKGA